jgi:hypothetical protein
MKASKSLPAKPLTPRMICPLCGPGPHNGHALGRGRQVETVAPEPARVGPAVPVAGLPGQGSALHRFPRGPARNRSRIDEPKVFVPCLPAQTLAEPGRARQVWKHPGQVRLRLPDPLALRGNSE